MPPSGESFFEALFGFAESDYVSTRHALLKMCAFEAVYTRHLTTGQLRVRKERALFRHPRLTDSRAVSCGWHSTPSIAELREEAAAAVQTFNTKHPGLLEKMVLDAVRGRTAETASLTPLHMACCHVVGESQLMHLHHPHAFFQAASQFNLLEFISDAVTPEDGVGHYVHDRTQGPACALACMGGTAYRNYLLHRDLFPTGLATDVSAEHLGVCTCDSIPESARGQRSDDQANMLTDLIQYITGAHGDMGSVSAAAIPTLTPALPFNFFFEIRNGYFTHFPSMAQLPDRLRSIASSEGIGLADVEEAMVSRLRIGLVEDVTVTLPLHVPGGRGRPVTSQTCHSVQPLSSSAEDPGKLSAGDVHEVTQSYNSALSLPVQERCTRQEWSGIEALSCIILRGTYEATLLAGVLHTLRQLEQQMSVATSTTSLFPAHLSVPPIFLTKVGGGVFKNKEEWIATGLAEALRRVSGLGVPLDIRLVHYRAPEAYYVNYFSEWPVRA